MDYDFSPANLGRTCSAYHGQRVSFFEVEAKPPERQRSETARSSGFIQELHDEAARLLHFSDARRDFQKVVYDEADYLEGRRVPRDSQTVRFSLALSGGGERAAAFHAGVLWRLAEAGLLQNVEYLSAVSGGAYTAAAFATHCHAASTASWGGLPPEGETKAWYLAVVAKMLCRMQANAGNFVRDAFKHPWHANHGDGTLPRIFDLPILLFSISITLVVNPLVFMICLVPCALVIDVFFGAGMRASFCVEFLSHVEMLRRFSPFSELWKFNSVLLIATFCTFMLLKILPCCRIRRNSPGNSWEAPLSYLVGHSLNSFLVRFTFAVSALLAFIWLLSITQIWFHTRSGAHNSQFADDLRRKHCDDYISRRRGGHDTPEALKTHSYFVDRLVADTWNGTAWFFDPEFETLYEAFRERKDDKAHAQVSMFLSQLSLLELEKHATGIQGFFLILGACLLVSTCVSPWCGGAAFLVVVKVAGPLFMGVLSLVFVQNLVYGELTPGALTLFRWRNNDSFWDAFATWCLRLALVVVPCYEEIRGIMHVYYERTIQKNFFHAGRDMKFSEITSCAKCPYVILTGTYSDYKSPNAALEKDRHSELGIGEFTFSPLHTGGEHIGYVKTSEHFSLGRCVALSGAGCLDAVSLSMTNSLTLRFWLEALNLSWGDFVLFQAYRNVVVDTMSKWAGTMYEPVQRFLHRLVGGAIWALIFVLLNAGWQCALEGAGQCDRSRALFATSTILFCLYFGLTFFSFAPGLDVLALSPVIRQIHQVSKHIYVGNSPPRMLYVTDGGAIDCTGLVQLLKRRCSRILLSLAAADPDDDLRVLKNAMEYAVLKRIAWFYDPQDPRRSVDDILARFKANLSEPFIHLGVGYECDRQGRVGPTGHLIVVKNRLPPSHARQPVQPLLTEMEVRGLSEVAPSSSEHHWTGMTTDMLGNLGCCDCCHRVCNMGRKFPHGSAGPGYLYLTPQWCASLARLGHNLSAEAVAAVSQAEPLADGWEAHVKH